MAAVLTRTMGHYERFSLCRDRLGIAPIVVFHVSLPCCQKTSDASILAAVTSLLSSHPLLRCYIAEPTATKPRFEEKKGISAKDIVKFDPEGAAQTPAVSHLLLAIDEGFEVGLGPLWRVKVLRSDSAVRLVLAVHHTVADGTACRNLTAELLRLLRKPSFSAPSSPTVASTVLPPTLEAAHNVQPSILHITSVVWRELVAPKLGRFIPFIAPSPSPPVFPNPPLSPPYLSAPAIKAVTFPSKIITGLKATIKKHELGTIHVLLQTAAFAAVSLARDNSSTPVHLVGDTPISLRPTDVSSCTGNYVASVTASSDFSGSTSFFPEARKFAARLASPAARTEGKWSMGMLAYVNNSEPAEMDGPTGWELFWSEKLKSEHPWGSTFEVSNLGVLPATGWEDEGLKDVMWAQPGAAVGNAFAFNVISVKDGDLAITLSWRRGSIDDGLVDRVLHNFETFVLRLANDGEGLAPNIALQDLLEQNS